MTLEVFGVRFDYLTVTYWSSHPAHVLASLLGDALRCAVLPSSDLFGMSGVAKFAVDEGQGSVSLFEQRDGSGRLHVRASGAITPIVFKALHSIDANGFLAGVVTRYDLAVDGNLTDLDFATLARRVVDIAGADGYDGRPVATSVAGDWFGQDSGRTLYVGSPTSSVRLRLYEKGIQLGSNPSWVRLEWQIRPAGYVQVSDLKADPPTERYSAILRAVTGLDVLHTSLLGAHRDPVAGGLPWLERMAVSMLMKVDSDTREQFLLRLSHTRW